MRFTTSAVLIALLFAAAPARLMAHPGHDHKVMGTVRAIEGPHVLLETNDGNELSFEIVKTTTWLRGREAGDPTDLKVGLRIVVNLGDAEEPLKAKEIQYAAVAADAAGQ